MAATQISIDLYLGKRRKTEQGTNPIKVRIYHQSTRKYYSIGLYTTVEDWKKIKISHPRGEIRNLKNSIKKTSLDKESLKHSQNASPNER